MFIPLLVSIITLSTFLHGMEIATKSDLVLYKKLINKSQADLKRYCHVSNNLDAIIDVAERSRNGHLMASLINICLPQDLIVKHIAPHFVEPIIKKYKSKLIAYKYCKDLFAVKKTDGDYKWNTFSRHDGTYSLVPKIEGGYAMWEECDIHNNRRNLRDTDTDKKYVLQLRSIKDKKGISNNLAVLFADNPAELGKKFVLYSEDSVIREYEKSALKSFNFNCLKFDLPAKHVLFSNDNTLLALGFAENVAHNLISICDTKTCSTLSWHLNGSISALCSAHHSPVFVAGSDQPHAPDFPNLFIFITEANKKQLLGHDAPITCVEFSPDDTRLLTCSYDAVRDTSIVMLWDTTDIDKITRVCEYTRSQFPVRRAFFVCNGQKVVLMQKNGDFDLLDGITGDYVLKDTAQHFCRQADQENHPLMIWSSKNKLLLSILDNSLNCFSSEDSQWFGVDNLDNNMVRMGLAADENTVVLVDEDENVYTFSIYDDQDVKDIDFIEKESNLVQLYEMLSIRKNNKGAFKELAFIRVMKAYIQKFSSVEQITTK